MRVLLAVAQPDLRLGIELLLDAEPGVTVVGGASETEGALALVATAHPDVMLLDWDLPGRPCSAVLAEARGADPRPAMVVLGRQARTEEAALAAGADAYVLRGDPPEQLLDAVRRSCDRRGLPWDASIGKEYAER